MISATGLFYLSLLTFQRLSGVFLHAGHPLPLVASSGFVGVALSSTLSQLLAPALTSELMGLRSRLVRKEEVVGPSLLSLPLFAGLERNFFRTALPSSIISTGVYARRGGGVPATSEVATQAQRKWIQRMGRLHGCHHCGYRPLVNFSGRVKYIADHMPPTNRVYIESKKMWRKVLNLTKMKQMLYPQCGKCCSIQASAARANAHKPIFHTALRSWHFVPLLAILIIDQEEVQEALSPLIDTIAQKTAPVLDPLVTLVNRK